MAKIKFITDSASDMPKDYAKEKNIDILPFHIYFRDSKTEEAYLDGVDITNDRLFEKMAAGEMPNSSQVTAFEIEEYLRALVSKNEYDAYVFVTISSTGSPTYSNIISAKKAMNADGIEFDLRVIDSGFYTIIYSYSIMAGVEAYENGKSIDEVCQIIENRCKTSDVYVTCDSLEYLKRGGRITGLSAAVGTLLDIKPIVSVRNGLVVPYDKVRGMNKAMRKILDVAKEKTSDGQFKFVIVYSTRTEHLSSFVEMTKQALGLKEIDVHQVGATIGVHIGPGLVGIMFQKI